MQIVYNKEQLVDYVFRSAEATNDHPILIDQFIENAFHSGARQNRYRKQIGDDSNDSNGELTNAFNPKQDLILKHDS